MRDIFPQIFLAVLLSTVGAAHSYAASSVGDNCPPFPPVLSLSLGDIYADVQGSIPNNAVVQKNRDLTTGVDQFMRYLEKALDNPSADPDEASAACAYENFRTWAKAGALTIDPKHFSREGAEKRSEYLIGINILALKFKTAGFAMDSNMLAWLRSLNRANMISYERATNRGNLRIWSAAAAGLYVLIEPDPDALNYQDRVWREAMAAIHDDGTIDVEVARSHRALIYHMFSLSATLVLRSARTALGQPETADDRHRLGLLADMIGRTLCDPREMERMAKATQEVPGDWAYRVPIGYGSDLLNGDWSRCGRPKADLSDPTSGGDARRSADVLSRLARQFAAKPSAHKVLRILAR
jgi:hypothetical protein